jgi:hypothetical protein
VTVVPFLLLGLLTGPSGAESWRPPELAVKPPPPLTDFESLRAIALRFLGTPYQMGGVGSPGIDCSAFVCRVYAEAGYALPRVSRDQARAGAPAELTHLRPGDLLFFADPGRPISHVGLYLGGDDLIHASTGQGEVVVANLSSRWFRERLVGARRVITSSTATITAPLPVPSLELVEHNEETELLPMLRRPPKRPEPSYGPELSGGGVTSVAVRGALITEAGRFGLTLAPEATLFVEDWALTLAAAVPIRLTVDEEPTIGALERKGDVLRFLRTATLGLPGADLHLSLSRLADLSLAGGLVDHLLPAAAVRGVPGLTVARSPLSLTAGARVMGVATELAVDDVVDPGLLALGIEAPQLSGLLRPSLAYAGDQRGQLLGQRRTVSALAAGLALVPVDTARWTLGVEARGTLQSAIEQRGGLGSLHVSGEGRFSRGRAIGLELYGEALSAQSLGGLFGPTYVAYREEHLAAWSEAGARLGLGGAAHLAWGRAKAGVRYAQGAGGARRPIDQRLEALLSIEGISFGGTTLLDLRAVYAARAPFSEGPVLDYVQASLRWRLAAWLFVEGYLGKGETLEGGAGVTVAFIP